MSNCRSDERVKLALGRLADTLSNPNFRRYAGAQFLHGAGMWAHHLAEVWLVYEITGRAFAVGLTVAVRSGSAVVLAPLAGTLADRMDRRRLLASTQAAKAVVASALALLALAMGRDLPLAVLFGAVAVLGVIGAIDTPLRRAFVRDVVMADRIDRAARLHTSVMSVGRFLGSGAAWLLLSLSASWACFAVNGATSLIAATLVLRVVPTTATTSADARAAGGRVLDYLLRTPAVTIPMALLCSFTLFGWNLAVLLPVVADKQLESGGGTFAVLAQAMAIGSLIGSVMMAASKLEGPRNLAILLAVFSATMATLSMVDSLVAGIVAIFVVGAFGGGFLSLSNGSVQSAADPRLQGRVSAAYGVVFVGARAVGGPILGWMVDDFGSRAALITVGIFTAACAALGLAAAARTRAAAPGR
jgi:MFS family permease